MENKRDKSVLFWLFFIFCTSVLVRFYLAARFGGINDFPDESVYWGYSKNIFQGKHLSFRGILAYDIDFLYPLIISVAHFMGDFEGRYHVMLLINAVISSSVVFPVYLLSKSILNDKKLCFMAVLASILVPEMFYSAKIIQENLYYPYVMWMFCLFYLLVLPRKYSLRRTALFTIFLCGSIYIKAAGACLIASYLLFYFIQLIFCKKGREKIICLGIIAESVCIYFIIDTAIAFAWLGTLDYSVGKTVFYVLTSFITRFKTQLSNNQVSDVLLILGVLFVVILVILLLLAFFMKRIHGRKADITVRNVILLLIALVAVGAVYLLFQQNYLYPSLTYVVYTGLFFGVTIPIVPIVYANKLEEQKRDFLVFSVLIWLVVTGAVCLTVLMNTNIRDETVRVHYRFIYHSFMPFLILFFYVLKQIHGKISGLVLCMISLMYAGLVMIAMPAASWSIIDAPSLAFWERILMMPYGRLVIKYIILLILIVTCVMILRGYTKKLCIFLFSLLILSYCLNSVEMYKKNAADCESQNMTAVIEEGKRIAEYLKDQGNAEDFNDVLLAPSTTLDFGLLEICIDVPYRTCLWKDLSALALSNDGMIPFGTLVFYTRFPDVYRPASLYGLPDYQGPQYIISQGPLRLKGYHIENLGLKDYYLWKAD